MIKTNIIITLVLFAFAQTAFGRSLTDDLNSLGANKDIIKRARALDPKNKVRVVQNRAVDRDLRLELAVNYGTVAGGDPYLQSDNLGGQVEFHITPNWSIGARYYQFSNRPSAEGDRLLTEAERDPSARIPGQDYPLNAALATVSWYPLYGKMNFFDVGVSQFDIYTLVGAGQIELESGPTGTWTAGGGIGVWLSKHFSTRFEVRYQAYEDNQYDVKRALDLTILSASIGLLI